MLIFVVIISILVYLMLGIIIFVALYDKSDMYVYNRKRCSCVDYFGILIIVICWPIVVIFYIDKIINFVLKKTIGNKIENFFIWMFNVKDSICEKLSKK